MAKCQLETKEAWPPPRQNQGIGTYTRLKRDIIRGTFPPGKKLLMSHLKMRYDLGTNPLREALSQLVAERLGGCHSQRGFRVALISQEELEDLYDARSHMEELLLSQAIERVDDEWEAEILATPIPYLR